MPNPPALTRRTALASLLVMGGGLLSGCTSGYTPERAPAPEGGRRLDSDVNVVARALAGEQETLALLASTANRHGTLRTVLAPMVSAHRAHVGLLAGAAPGATLESPSATSPPSSDPRRALAALTSAEQSLSTTLQRHAVLARSGEFARLLASMSAASSQHAAILSRTAVPAGRR